MEVVGSDGTIPAATQGRNSVIRRAPRRVSYTVLDNVLIEDARLSWRTLGVLTYLLSKPDNWEANVRHLASLRDEGDYSVRQALKELEATGYLVRRRERDVGGRWQWVQVIYECPSCDEGEDATMTRISTHGDGRGDAISRIAETHTAKIAPEEVLEVTTTDGTSEPDGSRARLDEKMRESRALERAEAVERFDAHFWPAYPARNGKKLDKRKAVDQWVKLSIEDQRAAVRGVRNYAASGQLPKDAYRWLRDRSWEDWQEPANALSARPDRGQAGAAQAIIDDIRDDIRNEAAR